MNIVNIRVFFVIFLYFCAAPYSFLCAVDKQANKKDEKCVVKLELFELKRLLNHLLWEGRWSDLEKLLGSTYVKNSRSYPFIYGDSVTLKDKSSKAIEYMLKFDVDFSVIGSSDEKAYQKLKDWVEYKPLYEKFAKDPSSGLSQEAINKVDMFFFGSKQQKNDLVSFLSQKDRSSGISREASTKKKEPFWSSKKLRIAGASGLLAFGASFVCNTLLKNKTSKRLSRKRFFRWNCIKALTSFVGASVSSYALSSRGDNKYKDSLFGHLGLIPLVSSFGSHIVPRFFGKSR